MIIDIYGDYASVQTLNQGMDRDRETILAALREVLPLKGAVLRNDVAVRKHEDLPLQTEVAFGEVPDSIAIRVNGLEWAVDLKKGQKTGIYLDQRDNYVAAARYARGRALDCFTSTGGFALHLAARAESVEAVDSSSAALASTQANAAANGIANITVRQADVLDLLPQYVHGERKFHTIVLDPPAFTKSRSAREGAARGYKEINQRALRLLEPDGVLITCSCSHHFSEAMLLETLASAALDANRTLRVLERRTQAQDHPILLTVPETHYLKCLIVQAIH